MTAPVADTENRLIALSLATCREFVDFGEYAIVCMLTAGHDGLHHDTIDHIKWMRKD